MTEPLEKQTVAQLRKAATKKKNRVVWHTFQHEEGRTHQLFERRERRWNQNVWTQPQSDASPAMKAQIARGDFFVRSLVYLSTSRTKVLLVSRLPARAVLVAFTEYGSVGSYKYRHATAVHRTIYRIYMYSMLQSIQWTIGTVAA